MITSESSAEEIKQHQAELQRAGFYLGDLDGIWGPRTERAHQAWEAAHLPAAPADPGSLENVRKVILETALHFIDLTESAPNTRWDNLAGGSAHHDPRGEELRQKLLETGWQPTWAYCIAFAEVCWRAGYRNRPELALISRLITPSVMSTFENFQRAKRISQVPQPGAIMLMQHGQTWQGHAGIVTAGGGITGATFSTIEGNTSSNEDSREGDGVYHKQHPLDFTKKSGLRLVGFVNPFLV